MGLRRRAKAPSLRIALLATVLVASLVVQLPAVLATPPERDEPEDRDVPERHGPEGGPEEPEGPETCQGGRRERGLGDVCPRSNGLLEVYHPETGRSVGFTHGLDPAPDGNEPSTPAGPTPPNCVSGAAGTYHIKVFYARASNDVDNYASTVATIRSLVDQSNGLVNDAAIATGGAASLKVQCTGGVVDVINAVLPTAMASASFSTIVTDLNNMGYTDGKVKHWVYYDDTGACGCGGTGHVYNDDTLAVSNLNNGNGGALFAVNFGYNSARIMMHELGHNLGAVQKSAPHSTDPGGSHPNGWHCWDGLDTMCYNDGAPNGNLYSTGFCSVEVFDCGKDDYFNLNPTGGSYLATHWNLGNAMNRYLEVAGGLTIRDDDDEQDTFFDFDYIDDVARKRLILPGDALTGATSATFFIRAKSLECGAVGNNHRLTSNGVTVQDYNPCNTWSSAVFEWKTFSVPLSSLTAGVTNTFEVIEIAGDWTDRNVHFAMDSDRDFGRTDAIANGVNVNGELMWYLVITKPVGGGGSLDENFDDNVANGWTLTGMWHITTRRSSSPARSLWYGQESTGTYDNGAANSGSATTPSTTVPSANGKLVFNSWYQTESGTSFDQKFVEVSTNGGSSWTSLLQINDAQNQWNAQMIDLASYAGQNVLFRFRFDTLDSVANNMEGWYVDDVKVAAITNTAPDACFSVTPSTGTTSTVFSVNASCSTDDGGTATLQVRWDWENDGFWDTSYTTTKTATKQYSTSGTKTIKLEVKDSGVLTDTATSSVLVNNPPSACFTVTPASGTTATVFSVNAACSSDDLTAAASLEVRWDWENDGFWDTSYTTTKTATKQYSTSGSKTIKVEVRDGHGSTSTTTRSVVVNSPPNACFTATPARGMLITSFQFDATCSSDDLTSGANLQVRWDFENDGVWDTNFSFTKTASKQYTSLGAKVVKVEVLDGHGSTSQTTRTVTVHLLCVGATCVG